MELLSFSQNLWVASFCFVMHFIFQSSVGSITVLNTRSGGFLYSSFPTDAQSLPSSTSPARDTHLLQSVSLHPHIVPTGIHSFHYGSFLAWHILRGLSNASWQTSTTVASYNGLKSFVLCLFIPLPHNPRHPGIFFCLSGKKVLSLSCEVGFFHLVMYIWGVLCLFVVWQLISF